jgi:hypothetical protein
MIWVPLAAGGSEVNGVLTNDERRVVGCAQQLGLILTSDWPDVATSLLVQGAEGEAVAELAGLSRAASPWLVDELVSRLLSELAVTELPADEVSELAGRLVGQAVAARTDADEFATVRELARLSPGLDYPGGVIGDAYYASEWLDCECHAGSPERDAAVALEAILRASNPLDIDPGLLSAVTVAVARGPLCAQDIDRLLRRGACHGRES